MHMTRRQRAIQAAALAAYSGQGAMSRREADDRRALTLADLKYGATRGVRKPLRPATGR